MENARDSALQSLCREYMGMLRPVASKFGLGMFVDDTIKANASRKCEATETEVELLARACDDERISRTEVPKILGKSYRRTEEDGDFGKIRKLPRVGIYSKVSALLFKASKDGYKSDDNGQ